MQTKNYYEQLGVRIDATKFEIKSAYRSLAKKYHPDTGGNQEKFLAIQLAWETLNDPNKKEIYDQKILYKNQNIYYENKHWPKEADSKTNSAIKDSDIKKWIKDIYNPINKTINQIIKPLNYEIKKLSADPYDDHLMSEFCQYINISRQKIEKVSLKYKSHTVPISISAIGLDLYYCFSQVQDALDELDRYTQGYVDDYLFDGKEMMKEAKRIQEKMSVNKKQISF